MRFIDVCDFSLVLFLFVSSCSVHLVLPSAVPVDLVVHNVHDERADFVVGDDWVELAERGETEEHVDDVGRQVDARLPLFSEFSDYKKARKKY